MSSVEWNKEYKIERYKKMNETVKKGSVVFAGSSLMEMFPVEQFVKEEDLPVTVYNRGVGGYVTEELLDHIDTCILDLEPSRLFINIGTNDLSNPQFSIETIMDTYRKILMTVKSRLPDIEIYLMAYYPVNYDAAADEMKECLKIRSNEKIGRANQAVGQLAKELELHYIDVNAPLLDEYGNLKAEYTIEGMHIKEEGYRAVFPLVKPYLAE